MSIIVTFIDRTGIIHAADSVLTGAGGNAGHGIKVFDIPHLNAGISVAGAYSFSTASMPDWISATVAEDNAAGNTSISAFVDRVRSKAQSDRRPDGGYIFHIAGFTAEADGHPEFHLVTNIHGIESDGQYAVPTDDFGSSEDFWTRDWPNRNLKDEFKKGHYQVYVNAFAPGRIAFVEAERRLYQLFTQIWDQPGWSLRRSATIDEAEVLLRARMNLINSLFQVSDYPSTIIGGPIETLKYTPRTSDWLNI